MIKLWESVADLVMKGQLRQKLHLEPEPTIMEQIGQEIEGQEGQETQAKASKIQSRCYHQSYQQKGRQILRLRILRAMKDWHQRQLETETQFDPLLDDHLSLVEKLENCPLEPMNHLHQAQQSQPQNFLGYIVLQILIFGFDFLSSIEGFRIKKVASLWVKKGLLPT